MTNPSQFLRVKLNKSLVEARGGGGQPEPETLGVELSVLATAAGIARLRAAGFEISLEPSGVGAPAELRAEG